MNIVELMDMMNYNLARGINGKSMLGPIQKKITDLFFVSLKGLSLEEQKERMDYFEANLYSNPEIFSSQKIDYSGISNTSEYFFSKKNEYINGLQGNRVR